MMIEALAVERSAPRAPTNKGRSELHLQDMNSEQWKTPQSALEKEWNFWTKYDAVTILPPKKSARKAEDWILDTCDVWASKSSDPDVLEAERRIIGEGFQKNFDETLRRDSPTASVQMSHVVCSLAALMKLELVAAGVTGAFLQGLPIQR